MDSDDKIYLHESFCDTNEEYHLSQEEIKALEDYVKELEKKEIGYKDCIANLEKELKANIDTLEKVLVRIEMLEKEKSQLEHETRVYRKLRKSLIGKIAGKVYNTLRKIKRKILNKH